jgi:hypothetical protein
MQKAKPDPSIARRLLPRVRAIVTDDSPEI